jgi:hypothetical protein
MSKTPVYSVARLNTDLYSEPLHKVCLDTGSSISVMNYAYAKQHLPHVELQTLEPFNVLGVGRDTPVAYKIIIDVNFITVDNGHVLVPVTFHLIKNLPTKVIVGNDILHPLRVTINLDSMEMTIPNCRHAIPITCRAPQADITGPLQNHSRIGKLAENYTIQPGHQASVPVDLDPDAIPSTQYYLFEPRSTGSYVHVARSVGATENPLHFAHIMNIGDRPVTLKKGTFMGEVVPLTSSKYKEPPTINTLAHNDSEEAFPLSEIQINPDLEPEQRRKLEQMLIRNRNAFGYGSHVLGSTTMAEFTIDTGDNHPVSAPPYHASPLARQTIDKTLAELLEDGIIEESDSPWASPAILVRQKGKDRFCVDYRKVNALTKSDQYPLPRIDDILSQFAGKKWFSTFDANKGFHQIPIAEHDKPKSAFRTHRGLHQYCYMPFGFKNGPAVFQRFMDKVLGRFKWQIALVYIDDIIVYSSDFETHLRDVETVLSLIQKSGVTLSLSKSHVAHQSIKALGHSVSNLGIGTLDETVRAIKHLSYPQNIKQLQRSLGLFSYYRKFIPDFSKIAAPLNKLLIKDVPWSFGDDQAAAFERLRHLLISAPILAHPNYDKPFILHTDASTIGIGGVLSQTQDDGQEHPIAYISRTLTSAEKNYTATELECLAIVWALTKLRPYLHGSKFTVVTDHSALQWLMRFNGTNQRLLRWSLELQPYKDYITIKHRPGKAHSNVDPLSRDPLPLVNSLTLSGQELDDDLTTRYMISISSVDQDRLKEIRSNYAKDLYFKDVLEGLQSDNPPAHLTRYDLVNGLIYLIPENGNPPRLCVPDIKLRNDLLHDHHDSITAGHLGVYKTIKRLTENYYWPGMYTAARRYVLACPPCQRNKADTSGPLGYLHPMPIPPSRWHTVSIDFAGPLPISGHAKYDMIMVVVDKLTKRTRFLPCHTSDGAKEIADLFFTEIVCQHGMPEVVISDQDSRFTSLFWQVLFKRFGTKLAMSTAYHPQTDGQSEAAVKIIKQMLRPFVVPKQDSWSSHLPALEFAYNSSRHTSTNKSPFELDLGYQPRSPLNAIGPTRSAIPAAEDFIDKLTADLHEARDGLAYAQEQQAKHHNKDKRPHVFKVGDQVKVSMKYVNPPFYQQKGTNEKLKPKFIGPYTVSAVIGRSAYRIDLPYHLGGTKTINVEYLRPYVQDTFPERQPQPPAPVEGEPPNTYEVDHIVNHRTARGRHSYLVHWKGQEHHEDSWEPEKNISRNTLRRYWAQVNNTPYESEPEDLDTAPAATDAAPVTPIRISRRQKGPDGPIWHVHWTDGKVSWENDSTMASYSAWSALRDAYQPPGRKKSAKERGMKGWAWVEEPSDPQQPQTPTPLGRTRRQVGNEPSSPLDTAAHETEHVPTEPEEPVLETEPTLRRSPRHAETSL